MSPVRARLSGPVTTALLIAGLLTAGPALAAEQTVKLTSLEWPPYAGNALPDKGASVAVVKAAYEAMGYKVTVEFYPWERAVQLAKDPAKGYAGYFPEYFSSALESDCTFSPPIGNGPLGFAQNKDAPIKWSTHDDLGKLKIGVVSGYVNEEEFDKRVAAGKQPVEEVVSDDQNLKKVAAKRIPAAIIDRNVMQYLLKNDASLGAMKDKLSFNDKLLEDKKLYICFRKGGDAAAMKALAEGLKKIDIDAISRKYFQ